MSYLVVVLFIIVVLAFGLFMLVTGVQLFAFPQLISSIVGPEDYKVIEDTVGKRKVGTLFLLIPFKRIEMSDSIYDKIYTDKRYKSLMRRGMALFILFLLIGVSSSMVDLFVL